MKTNVKYVLLVGVLAGFIATGLYFYLNPKNALHFVVPNFTGLANIGIDIKGDTAYLDINTVMENMAPYTIDIQKIEYVIQLAEADILREKHQLNLNQKSGQIDTVNLLVRLPYKEVQDAINAIQNQDSTTVGAAFSITYKTMFGEFSVPTRFNTAIKTPKPPEIKLNKIRLGFFNFKETRFELILDITVNNENDIEVSLANLAYNAAFGDNLTGSGSLTQPTTVAANAKTNMRLPIAIDVDKPMKLIGDIIANQDQMDYKLNLRGNLIPQKTAANDVKFNITLAGNAELVK